MQEKSLVIERKNLRGDDGYKVFSIRVKEGTIAELEKLSMETNRSRNELINLLLEYAIQNCEVK
mgnify:FL=1